MERLEVINKQYVRVILVPGADTETVRKITEISQCLFKSKTKFLQRVLTD